MLQVSRIVADAIPGEAVIATGQNPHAALLQIAHGKRALLHLAAHAHGRCRLCRDAPFRGFVQRGIGDADRGHHEDAVFRRLQRITGPLVGECRVIDQLDAVLDAKLHGLAAAGMGGDALAVGPSDLADGIDFGLGHHRLFGARMRHEFVAGRIDLQRVDAFAHEHARGFAEIIGPVADHGEGFAVAMIKANIAQACRRRHLWCRSEHTWARDLSRGNRIADDDIQAGFGRGHGIQACKAAVEIGSGILGSQQDMLLIAQRMQIGRDGEADMGMGLDQSRHQGGAAAVDVTGILAGQGLAIARDGRNSIALNPNLAGKSLIAAAVDDSKVAEDDRVHGGWPSQGAQVACF